MHFLQLSSRLAATGNRQPATGGWELFCTGVLLSNPPDSLNTRKPASNLAKIAVRAGIAWTADRGFGHPLWGVTVSPSGRGHSTGNRRLATGGCGVLGCRYA